MDNDLDLMFEIGGLGKFKLSSVIGIGEVKPRMVVDKERVAAMAEKNIPVAVKSPPLKQDGWCFDVFLINGMNVKLYDPKWSDFDANKEMEKMAKNIQLLELNTIFANVKKEPLIQTVGGM